MKTTLRSFVDFSKKAAWMLPVLLLCAATNHAQAQSTAARQAVGYPVPAQFSAYAEVAADYVDVYAFCPEAGALEIYNGDGDLLSTTEVSANRSPVVRIHGIPLHPYLIRHRGVSGKVSEVVITEAP